MRLFGWKIKIEVGEFKDAIKIGRLTLGFHKPWMLWKARTDNKSLVLSIGYFKLIYRH